MKKITILIALVFLLGVQTACVNDVPAPTESGDAIEAVKIAPDPMDSSSTSEAQKVETMVAATLSAIPSVTSTPFPTSSASVQTISPEPVIPSIQLDRSDFLTIVQWVSFLIIHHQPEMISDVIGQNGAQFWPYAIGGKFLGYNNAEFIVKELENGLTNASPLCLGYDPDFGTQPDKGIIFFKEINFDWYNLGFGDEPSKIVSFLFFRMEQGWELVFISPVPDEFWLELKDTLRECP